MMQGAGKVSSIIRHANERKKRDQRMQEIASNSHFIFRKNQTSHFISKCSIGSAEIVVTPVKGKSKLMIVKNAILMTPVRRIVMTA